jgi:hypothetical protein
MTSKFPSTVVLIALVLFAVTACNKPAAPDANRASKPAPKETVDPVAIEGEIIKLERQWAMATQQRDLDTLRRILADDLIMTLVDGTVGNKEGELKNAESGAVTVEAWELLEPKVTVLSADSAFITGRGVLKKAKYKDPATGKMSDISGQYRFTDVYVRRNGVWQAVASHTTQIENPPPLPSPSVEPSVAASPK